MRWLNRALDGATWGFIVGVGLGMGLGWIMLLWAAMEPITGVGR